VSRRLGGLLLVTPALALLAAGFLWPLAVLLRMSLNRTDDGGTLVPAFTADTYTKLAADDFTWGMTWDSLRLAAVAACIALLLAYPMALFLFRSGSKWRGVLAVAAVAPLLVSGTARVIGWLAILGDRGVINASLAALGLPKLALINNWTGVQIGLAESVMPYAVLTLLAGFGRLDGRLEEAAATLGARPLAAFWLVTVPLTLPAIIGAWLLAFVLGVSAFITPKLMGGGRVFTLATEIYDAATQTLDWPEASALSVYVLVLLALFLAIQATLGRRVRT
jgi:putative spermidine/putrescine transport system permease protein